MNGTKRSVKRWVAIFLCFCIVISGINTGGFSGIFSPDGEVAHAASNYIYFDNGLAGYDKVEYSVDGGDYQEMTRLAAITDKSDPRYPSDMTNINSEYVYVTNDPVPSGNITFRGTASGTVYDTASNYQISSASREWGYDYKDFVWTSDAIKVDGNWDCYYAPALAMQNKYNGRDPVSGELVDFIKNVGWAALDEEEPNLNASLDLTKLDFATNGFSCPVTFSNGNIAFTVNGSAAAPITYSSDKWEFTPAAAGLGTLIMSVPSDESLSDGLSEANGMGGEESPQQPDSEEITETSAPTDNEEITETSAPIDNEEITETSAPTGSEEITETPVPTGSGEVFGTIAQNSFNPDIAPIALDSTEFSMRLSGTGQLLTLQPTADGTITLYANGSLLVNGEEFTDIEEQVSEPDTSSGATTTLYKMTASVAAGESYAISSESAVEIYSVTVADGAGSQVGSLEDTLAANLVGDALTDNVTVTHDTGTQFEIPAGSTVSAGTLTLPKGTALQVTTANGEARLTVNEGADNVAVTDIAGGSPLTINSHTKRFSLEANKTYGITSDSEPLTQVQVGYRGTQISSGGVMIGSFGDDQLKNFVKNSKDTDYYENITIGDTTDPDFFTITAENITQDKRIRIKNNQNGTGIGANGDSLTLDYCLDLRGGGDASGTGGARRRTVDFTVTEPATVRVYALAGGDNRSLRLFPSDTIDNDTDSSPYSLLDEKLPVYSNDNKGNIPAYAHDIEPGSYSITGYGGGIFIYRVEVWTRSTSVTYTFDSFTKGVIYPENGFNRTFTGFQYSMDGITGLVNGVNEVGLRSLEEEAEGNVALGDGDDHIDASIKTFDKATATIYDYFSDWELAGNKLADHKYILGRTESTYYKHMFERSKYKGYDDKSDDPVSPTELVTYAESANSISYAYQGDLWNHAIYTKYAGKTYNGRAVYPLYFGSNSWFTSLDRYLTYDRYEHESSKPTTPWNIGDYGDGYRTVRKIPERSEEKQEKPNKNKYFYAYRVPEERAYLSQFTKDSAIYNPSLGMSNSRGLAGLVVQKETEDGSVSLLGDTIEKSPYFDADFIRGNNEKKAVYGAVYENVAFRFKEGASGYYEFDSTSAEDATRLTRVRDSRDEYYMDYTGKDTKSIKADVYKTPGDSLSDQYNKADGQFFPFNGEESAKTFSGENLMFGMKLTIPLSTYTDSDRRDGILKFSGDDDVWAYISRDADNDGVIDDGESTLALDIGGTHGARGGVIDMKHGYAVAESTYDDEDPGNGIVGSTTSVDGNAQKESTDDRETAAFVIATNNGVEETSGATAISESRYFADTYTGTGTYEARFVTKQSDGTLERTKAGETPDYFQVTLNGSVSKNGKEIQTSGKTTVNFAIYELNRILSSTTDTIGYQIDIFYLERGLNSSNLKVAFKNVPISDRAAQKQWTDSQNGFNLHDGEANGKQEDVKVDLYREYATYLSEATAYSNEKVAGTDDDTMVIRASAYQKDGKDEKTVFAEKDQKVAVDVDVGTDASCVVLALNGIKLTKTVYNQFNLDSSDGGNPLNLTIQQEENPDYLAPDDEGYIPVIPGKKLTVSFTAAKSTRADPTVEYNSSTEDTWRIDNTNGWLVDVYPLAAQDFSQDALTNGAAVTEIKDTAGDPVSDTMEVTATYQEQSESAPGVHPKTVNGGDMRFLLIENVSNAELGQFPEHSFYVAVVPKEDALAMTTKVNSDPNRSLYCRKSSWKGLLRPPAKLDRSISYSTASPYYVGTYGGGTDLTDYTLKEANERDDYFISLVVHNTSDEVYDNSQANKRITPIEFAAKYTYTVTELEKLTDQPVSLSAVSAVLLKEKRNWYKHWELLADNLPVNGVEYPYTYYLSPETVNDTVKNYSTRYYAIGDNEEPQEIAPITEEFNIKGGGTEKLTLYQFADAENISTISIVNTPYTDLQVSKEWILQRSDVAGTLTEKEPEEITVTVYQSTKKNPAAAPENFTVFRVITFTPIMDGEKYTGKYKVKIDGVEQPGEFEAAADTSDSAAKKIKWEWTIESVPLYQEETGAQYQYYAVEGPLTVNKELEVFYDPEDEVKVILPGISEEQTLHPFASDYDVCDTFTMGIENRIPPKKVNLQIEKTDRTSHTPLEGAEFALYVKGEGQEDEMYQLLGNGTTDTSGQINFDLSTKALTGLQPYRKLYRVVETKAPEGYTLDKHPVSFVFTVNSDGTLTVPTEKMEDQKNEFFTGYELVPPPDEETGYTLRIFLTNAKNTFVLPDSGGSGVSWMLLTGSILLAAALLLAVWRRRQSARS